MAPGGVHSRTLACASLCLLAAAVAASAAAPAAAGRAEDAATAPRHEKVEDIHPLCPSFSAGEPLVGSVRAAAGRPLKRMPAEPAWACCSLCAQKVERCHFWTWVGRHIDETALEFSLGECVFFEKDACNDGGAATGRAFERQESSYSGSIAACSPVGSPWQGAAARGGAGITAEGSSRTGGNAAATGLSAQQGGGSSRRLKLRGGATPI